MTAFSAACDAIFADPNMAVDALWRPACGGPSLPCRVILARPDVLGNFGDARIISDSVRIDVRASQVPVAGEGDIFDVGGTVYIVQGQPRRDRLRLVWQCEAPAV